MNHHFEYEGYGKCFDPEMDFNIEIITGITKCQDVRNKLADEHLGMTDTYLMMRWGIEKNDFEELVDVYFEKYTDRQMFTLPFVDSKEYEPVFCYFNLIEEDGKELLGSSDHLL